MVRRVEHSEVNYKVIEEGGSALESVEDIKALTLPKDWFFVEGELFDDTLRAEWNNEQGDTVVVTPYPIVTEDVHSVSYSGVESPESSDCEGWQDAVEGALHLIADHTDDGTFRILDRSVETVQTFHDSVDVDKSDNHTNGLGKKPPAIADAHDMVNADCQMCGEDSLLLEHQEVSTTTEDKVRMIYRCRCPTCSSVMEIEEIRNETW